MVSVDAIAFWPDETSFPIKVGGAALRRHDWVSVTCGGWGRGNECVLFDSS
jgi:hypothetical protein